MPSLSDPQLLAGTIERAQRLTPAKPPLWGVMSAHEMVLHLTDAMAGASQQLLLERRPSALGGRLGRFVALHSGLRWPKNVPTVPELERRGQPKPAAALFPGDQAALAAALQRFAALPGEALSPEHPYFGPMTHAEWMIWAYRHADHHLRQFGC
jgi:hypothetical protein